ncbi:MAG TPA: zinc-dependent metalloprotease family protein, partial [Chitinophagaceae bacterium]|nr:zinc-dependent metalloprotease family protein [Chitinophagaceae bacterium]
MRKSLIVFLAIFLSLVAFGQQNHWSAVSETVFEKNPFANRARPSKFQLFQLNEKAMEASLRSVPSEKRVSAKSSSFIITIPNEDGQPEQYKLVEAPVMDASITAKHPEIKSYAGYSLLDPTATVRFSLTPMGFRGVILSGKKPAVYIKKAERGKEFYIIVSAKDLPAGSNFECTTTGSAISQTLSTRNTLAAKNADDGKLRKFRLAFATSVKFSNFYGGGSILTEAEQRDNVRAELAAQLTIVNGHIERDFGVRLEMIDNDKIIFINSLTDPLTDGDPDSDVINAEAQKAITDSIGSDNFDVGHLLRIGDLGDAYGKAGAIGSICVDDTKARGFTTRGSWHEIDVYSEIMLTHEFGHQLGANHTFTHTGDNDNAQMEPGSGSTIMSYGGSGAITDGNMQVVDLRDHYFHAISIQQVTDYINGVTCGTKEDAGNSVPTADGGNDYTIPKSTPFKLTGVGSDPDGDALTYTWEQMDKLVDGDNFGTLPSVNDDIGPVFRSRPPFASPIRYFPIYSSILMGVVENEWEKVPAVSRDLNFRFTVRDNHPGAGQNNSDDVKVTVDGDIGPFILSTPNNSHTWCPGTHTVTWDVNGSDALAANVKISLSTDDGATFPTVLVASTPNDGSAAVTIPCTYGTTARIMVEAIDNIFFNISDKFIMGDNTPPTFNAPPDITIYKDENCEYDASLSITGDVTDEADDCSTGLEATYEDAFGQPGCEGETIILRTWTLEDGCGLKTIKNQKITITDSIAPTFTAPADIIIYKDDNCDYDASLEVTGDVTDEADNCDTDLNATYTDVVVDGDCMGEEIITRTWSLTDDCGNTTIHKQIITAKDTTAPVISNISANPSCLWPPNHKMVKVTIRYDVNDNCSDAAHITKELSITSNEPINGLGDGDTAPIDYEVDGADAAHT